MKNAIVLVALLGLAFSLRGQAEAGRKQITQADSVKKVTCTDSPDTLGIAASIDMPDTLKKRLVFEVAEEMPDFPGGMQEMMKYLMTNMIFRRDSTQEIPVGRTIVVRFIVEADGQITEPVFVRSMGPNYDEVIKKLVLSMPCWTPGKMNGVPVAVYFTLPIRIKLDID